MDTKNKVAIVTGGIGGIGFVTTQHLLRNGVAYVAILDVVQQDDTLVVDNLKKLKQEFNKGNFGYYNCDVTDVEQFTACYKKVVDLKSYVDILVNNAGILKDKLIDREIAVNFVYNKIFGVRILCLCPGLTETNITTFHALKKNMPEFVSDKIIKDSITLPIMQKPDNVALAIVEIIQKGDDGDVWFAANDEPPYAVGAETDVEKLRIHF